MKQLNLMLTIALLATFCWCAGPVQATLIASDDSADGVYDDGWQSGDNGGSGFFGWTLGNTGGNSGHFIFDSTKNGGNVDTNGDGDINAGGRAWGMFANSGETADAFRGFAPLQVGDTLSFAIDNGFIDQGGAVGAALRSLDGDNRFEFLFVGGDNQYRINDGTVGFGTGINFTDQGLSLEFTLTGIDTYDITITTLFDGNSFAFNNRTLEAASAGEDITNFRAFNANAGGGDAPNVYVNSLAINQAMDMGVPEPATALLGAVGMTALGLRRRRLA